VSEFRIFSSAFSIFEKYSPKQPEKNFLYLTRNEFSDNHHGLPLMLTEPVKRRAQIRTADAEIEIISGGGFWSGQP
jgi:hypothetical protein